MYLKKIRVMSYILSIEAIVHCIHETTKQYKISIFVYCVIIFFDKRCTSPQGYLFSDIDV